MPVFLDDPNAIPMMKKRIANLEKQRTYWKGIKKTVPRTYDSSLGDQRWYMLDNVSTKLRTAKKKLEQLEQNKRDGVKLQRNTTYKHGKPRFYYTQQEGVKDDFAKFFEDPFTLYDKYKKHKDAPKKEDALQWRKTDEVRFLLESLDSLIERRSGNVHKKKKRNQADQNRRDKRWDASRFCKSCGNYKEEDGKCDICGAETSA